MNAAVEAASHGADVAPVACEVTARDGLALGARLYLADAQADPRDAIVFSSGGGLSVVRYHHFLASLAAQGVPVLAFDYRGVGLSRPRRLRGYVASLQDWSELDQAGAIDALRSRFPLARLSSVSHSIGGLVASTAPNANELAHLVFISPHTGYWRDYAKPWRAPMTLAWHAMMPLLAHAVGYFPGRALRLGDDIPRGVALQWAGRRHPRFELGRDAGQAARSARMLANAAHLTQPAMAITFSDDAFSTDAGVRRFLHLAPRMPFVRRHFEATPAQRFGHFGFFSRRSRALWPLVARFVAEDRGRSGEELA